MNTTVIGGENIRKNWQSCRTNQSHKILLSYHLWQNLDMKYPSKDQYFSTLLLS